jgi:hypothetical protein
MTNLTTVGFEPDADFPLAPYERVHIRLAPRANPPTVETWRQFALAWNAVVYRFQACAEQDQAFRELFDRLGSDAGGLERYRQQRELFGCITNACAVIESCCYAAFAVGALVDPSAFAIDTAEAQRSVDPKATAEAYSSSFPTDPFTSSLNSLLSDQSWRDLKDLRNVLVHRAAPGKTLFRTVGSGPATPPDQLRLGDFHLPDVDFDARVTGVRREWVARFLDTFCRGLDEFTTRQFP